MRLRRFLRPEYLIPLIALVVRILPGPRTVDDAYITFRYARNLLEGVGMVYNPGEWVLGTTTPLYTGLLAFWGWLTGGTQIPFPVVALAINAVADALTCLILIRLGRRLGSAFSGLLTAAFWALSPMSVTFAIGGMETSFFVLLMMATLYLHSSHRPVLAAFLGGLSLLTRPDALLFILPIGLERLIQGLKRSEFRPSLAELFAFLLPVVPWAITSINAYGNPLPHSLLAKVGAYSLPPEAAFVRLLQHFATPFMGNLVIGAYAIGLGLLFLPALSIIGWRYTIRSRPEVWPLAAFPAAYLFAFSLANPLIFRWYLVPPLPLYVLGICLGFEQLSQNRFASYLKYGFAILVMTLTLNAWTIHPDHGLTRPAPKMAYVQLEELYIQAAEDLQPVLDDNDVIAAGDIGALGYFTRARILDTVGLITPVTLDYFPIAPEHYVINYAVPSDLIIDQQPDYLVILEVYGRAGLLRDERFNEGYRLIATYPTDIYGSKAMLVFERRDEQLK
jgi:hypothetical protein